MQCYIEKMRAFSDGTRTYGGRLQYILLTACLSLKVVNLSKLIQKSRLKRLISITTKKICPLPAGITAADIYAVYDRKHSFCSAFGV